MCILIHIFIHSFPTFVLATFTCWSLGDESPRGCAILAVIRCVRTRSRFHPSAHGQSHHEVYGMIPYKIVNNKTIKQ